MPSPSNKPLLVLPKKFLLSRVKEEDFEGFSDKEREKKGLLKRGK